MNIAARRRYLTAAQTLAKASNVTPEMVKEALESTEALLCFLTGKRVTVMLVVDDVEEPK